MTDHGRRVVVPGGYEVALRQERRPTGFLWRLRVRFWRALFWARYVGPRG